MLHTFRVVRGGGGWVWEIRLKSVFQTLLWGTPGFGRDTLLSRAPHPTPNPAMRTLFYILPFYVKCQQMRGFWCPMKSENH